MPVTLISQMEKAENVRTNETDDDHLREVQVCNNPEEEIQSERTKLIPGSDNRSEPQRWNYHSIN